MDKFNELDAETIEEFFQIFDKKSFPIKMNIQFLGSDKQKQLIKISKIPEQYAFALGKEVLVIINESLMNTFDDECISILFEQEIDKLDVNLQTGKIKTRKPDLSTFSGIINKWGVQKVARANEVDALSVEQKEDKEQELL